jgi:hypothetical protein
MEANYVINCILSISSKIRIFDVLIKIRKALMLL